APSELDPRSPSRRRNPSRQRRGLAARRPFRAQTIRRKSMPEIISSQQGGYSFLKGGTHPFSGGVACQKGHALTRVRFRAPQPLAEGLAKAASFIKAQNRPLAALAACELRSPAPMSLADFAAFNRH